MFRCIAVVQLVLILVLVQHCHSRCSHYTTVHVSPSGRDSPGCEDCSSITHAVNEAQDCTYIIVAAHQFIEEEMSLAGKKNVFIIGQSNSTSTIPLVVY